jgi:hypothetical protein
MAARACSAPVTGPDAEQELWALLAVYQAPRMAMTAAAGTAGADPARARTCPGCPPHQDRPRPVRAPPPASAGPSLISGQTVIDTPSRA